MFAVTKGFGILLTIWTVAASCWAVPTAVEDYYFTSHKQTLNVPAPGVLGNDSGGSLAASLVTDPARGSVELNPDGSFVYTPLDGFLGADIFGYEVTDGSRTARAMVVIACTHGVNCKAFSGIAAGLYHSIALKSDGTVWTWGDNQHGQLGDGTATDRTTPVQVQGLTGVVAIAGGSYHSLALKSDGTVWAWGSNSSGQLGNGTTTKSYTPMQVQGLTGVVAIAAGGKHSLALKSDGTVWAWGNNSYGQLGDGTITNSSTPVQLQGLTGVVAIAGGYYHTVALKQDGTVWACGDNSYGQLGNGTTTNSSTPVQVQGLTGVMAIAGGSYHSLALKSDGTVWAWGYNWYGQLGNGTTTNSSTPVQVQGLTGVVAIAGGGYHSLALKSDGTVWAWGNNSSGQLGNGTTTKSYTPMQVQGLTGVVAIAAGGYYHTVALKQDGTVWACGDNSSGQLGQGGPISDYQSAPIQTKPCIDVIATACGWVCTAALKSDSTVWTWGSNSSGQLGDGTNVDRSTPVQVQGLTGVVAIGGGGEHSLALKSDGTVWAWGSNSSGQLGNGTTTKSYTPVQVQGLTGVVAIAAGGKHSLALKSDGTVWAWGSNWYGQLGDGKSSPYRIIPVQVQGLTGVVAIAGGGEHSLALKSDGTVWAWGSNSSGQLGNGTTTKSYTPMQVQGLTGVVAIAAGGKHSLALKSDGTVWAWGDNWYGQLGNGTTTNRFTPVQVQGLTGVVAIAGGYYHTIALKQDGTVWTWGYNWYGQLGDGTSSPHRITPVQVQGLTGVVAIAGGYYHTVALKQDGTVWTWGSDSYGQLGDGRLLNFPMALPLRCPLGYLSVTIQPQTAADSGAKWRRVGTTEWFGSGYVEAGVRAGSHEVEFNNIPCWTKPGNLLVNVNEEELTTVTATYAYTGLPETQISIGNGMGSWHYPLATSCHDARVQTIYTASEIGSRCTIEALALDVTTLPGQTMNNFTIRMKHTDLSAYPSLPVWELEGWTTVYQANQSITSTGWKEFELQTPFDYNGVQNLMVDISFNNTSYTRDGMCRYTATTVNRSICYRTNSGYGDPLGWSGRVPTPNDSVNIPNIRIKVQGTEPPVSAAIGNAKLLQDGTMVQITGAIVSAAWEDFFYVEEEDRSSGIRVEQSSNRLTPGTKVDVTGSIWADENGECFIRAWSVSQGGAGNVDPLGLANVALGGGACGLQNACWGWLLVRDETGKLMRVRGEMPGLNNIGLLVKTWGRFTKTSDTTFELDDGSGAIVKCVVPSGVSLDSAWTYATVTGISSCERVGNEVRPLLRVRTQSDIVPY